MKLAFSIFLILFSFIATAKEIFVDVLSSYAARKIQLEFPKGLYSLNLDNEEILSVKSNDIILLISIGNKVSVHKNNKVIGTYRQIFVNTDDAENLIKLQIQSPKQKTTFYEDQLFIRTVGARLQIVNELELNKYIKGVIEAEIGNVKNHELLKMQAVISRTYALRHLDRHKTEGAQLCDKVHCQVFHGKSRFNLDISPAVDSTFYQVIVDVDSQLIEAVFHANCGGLTVNSEDVWLKPRSYLKAVVDTFCTTEKQAYWSKEIDKDKWKKYFSYHSDHTYTPYVFELEHRLNYLPSCTVSTKFLREQLNLRSTYFSAEEKDDKILLKGRGFGHGVGMCQEGAIRMANLGRTYLEIINFYYCDVSVLNFD